MAPQCPHQCLRRSVKTENKDSYVSDNLQCSDIAGGRAVCLGGAVWKGEMGVESFIIKDHVAPNSDAFGV